MSFSALLPIKVSHAAVQMNTQTGSRPIRVVRVTDWHPVGVRKALAASPRNFVGLMDDGCSVLKYPQCKTRNSMEALYEEAARYGRLGSHANLVVFKGVHDDGIMFEYCERGQLEDVIRSEPHLTDNERTTIGKQIVQCLIHLHEHNFIHCDLNVNNVFVTSSMTAKVGDIQGQLYRPDGTIDMPTMSQENAKSRHPHAGEDEFSWRTDIFALGTLLYHLWYGHPPFPELDEYRDEQTIQARFHRAEYPINIFKPTNIDRIIVKCWSSEYGHATEILEDMEILAPETGTGLANVA